MGRHKDRPGYLYVLRSTVFVDWYKIGRTTDLERRFKELATNDMIGNFGFIPVLTIKVADCVSHERMWHHAFEQNRMEGEWFELTQFHIQRIVKTYGVWAGRLQSQRGIIRKLEGRYKTPHQRWSDYYSRISLGY